MTTSNAITTIPADAFHKLTQLKTLDLGYNKITTIPPNGFDKLTELEYLSLGHNCIASIPTNGPFHSLSKLKTLYLNHNKFAAIPAALFDHNTNLETLMLNDNHIASVPLTAFVKLTQLTWLDFSDNPIQSPSLDVTGGRLIDQAVNYSCRGLAVFDGEFRMLTGVSRVEDSLLLCDDINHCFRPTDSDSLYEGIDQQMSLYDLLRSNTGGVLQSGDQVLPCGNGECVDGILGDPVTHTCTCDAGWTGANCTTNKDECAEADCGNGVCEDGLDTFACVCNLHATGAACNLCEVGWVGADCNTDINECVDADCGNGVCPNGIPEPSTCDCPREWIGTGCTIHAFKDCPQNPDCGNGKCKDGVVEWSCICDDEWSGKSCKIKISDASSSKSSQAVTVGSIGVVVLLLLVVAGVVIRKRRLGGGGSNLLGWTPAARRARALTRELAAATLNKAHLTFLASYSRKLFSNVTSAEEHAKVVAQLELKRHSIRFEATLGEGNYGLVQLATLKQRGEPALEVAVKSRPLKETDATIDEALCTEGLVLHAVQHPNILKLVGICTDSLPFLIVTELMSNGDLKSYLRLCRPTEPEATRKAVLTLLDISVIIEKVCSAMKHLESLSVIHRDIAARNVLVGTAPTDVKLGDLGAARSVFRVADREYSATSEHMPARWMAPESLKTATFSSKTDVWGFGVLCWEISSLAQTPYGMMGIKDMVDSLNNGDRLMEAPFTPPGLYKVMLLCFSTNPKRRPNFSDLIHNTGAIRGAIAVSPHARMTLAADNTLISIDTGATQEAMVFEAKVAMALEAAAKSGAEAGDAINDDGYDMPSREASNAPITSAFDRPDMYATDLRSLAQRVADDVRDGYDLDPSLNQDHRTPAPHAGAGSDYEIPRDRPLSNVRVQSLQEPGYQYVDPLHCSHGQAKKSALPPLESIADDDQDIIKQHSGNTDAPEPAGGYLAVTGIAETGMDDLSHTYVYDEANWPGDKETRRSAAKATVQEAAAFTGSDTQASSGGRGEESVYHLSTKMSGGDGARNNETEPDEAVYHLAGRSRADTVWDLPTLRPTLASNDPSKIMAIAAPRGGGQGIQRNSDARKKGSVYDGFGVSNSGVAYNEGGGGGSVDSVAPIAPLTDVAAGTGGGSIARARKPSVYLGFEGADEGTRL
jgi:serine/threonine protein kinase